MLAYLRIAGRVTEVFDRVFVALDEPFADASAVPTFLVSEATRKQVTVVLTGDGADEVFGGYRRYWSELHAGLWNRIPAPLRNTLTALLMRLPVWDTKGWRIGHFIRRIPEGYLESVAAGRVLSAACPHLVRVPANLRGRLGGGFSPPGHPGRRRCGGD